MSNDDFSDIRAEVNGMGAGVLAGDGVDFHNKVKSTIAKDGSGFDYALRCDSCGRTLIVTAPWTELIYMGQGVVPPNQSWKHDGHHGCFMPTADCPHCHDDIRLGVTPDECNRNLTSGIAARKITKEQIGAFIAQNLQRR